MIQAIQTSYNGYLFRSRLEARWAVFFDAAGIEYQYEPEGFEVEINEHEKARYLPDFYLPKNNLYCEVKPNLEALKEESEKLSWMIDYGGPMADGLVILGQIPFVKDNVPVFIKYYHDEGVCSEYITFNYEGVVGSHFDLVGNEFDDFCATAPVLPLPVKNIEGGWENLYEMRPDFPTTFEGAVWLLSDRDIPITAYSKARSARFEHGEKPDTCNI